MNKPIHVFSEIGELETVLLKRPGKETENLTPDIMERLLFDDIPYLPIIQEEHDMFAKTLTDNGVEVLYLEKLVEEALDAGENKSAFLEKMLYESNLSSKAIEQGLTDYLTSMSTSDMVDKLMSGVRKNEVDVSRADLASVAEEKDYPFFMDPMPNLYFTRDPAASMGEGLTINKMTFAARQRESMFMEEIINHHPRFANKGIDVWRDRDHRTRLEGGDELILNDKVVAIGISQRSSANAIEQTAKALFARNSGFEKVIAIKIPHNRAMMHLDTVFTMINHDQFTVFPGIMSKDSKMDIYIIEPKKNGELNISYRDNLENALKEVLNLSELDLIETGNGDAIVAPREQWNDGSNTLAIAPGVVVTYNRNYVSNEILRQHGVKVLEINSSEMSRGRGGPRCMSMPLVRKDLK